MTKMHVLHCRISSEEKEILEKRAAALCMSSSQYIRFRLLGENENNPYESIRWLDQHYKMVMRLVVTIYWNMRGLTHDSFTPKMQKDVEDNIAELYQILGITREDDK